MDYEKQMEKAVALQTKFSPTVKKLLTPALNALGIDYFWFVRLMAGAFHISIGVQPPMVELYRKRKTKDLYFGNEQILLQKQTVVFWDLQERDGLASDMLSKLELKQGICIFRRESSCVDVFYIASTKKDSANIYSLYLNYPDSILRLIGFFQEVVLPKLPISEEAFLLPYMDKQCLTLPPLSKTRKSNSLEDFYDATKLKKFTLHKEQQNFSLSVRELQCLHHLAQGYTSKDIAHILQISFRTVEHYLSNLRIKVGCHDKAALVELYRANDLARWIAD